MFLVECDRSDSVIDSYCPARSAPDGQARTGSAPQQVLRNRGISNSLQQEDIMVTDAVKQVIGVFYPVVDPDEALTSVVLEWIDIKISRMEESIRSYERKYGMNYREFDEKIRGRGAVFEEEDDWIDWGDTIDLVQQLIKTRGEVLSQLSIH